MRKIMSGTVAMCLLVFYCLPATASILHSRDSLPEDTIREPTRFFELSIGHTLLFISETRLEEVRKNASIVVPTNAMLFFVEFRPVKKMRIPLFMNIPTQSKQFIVDNKIVSERASPTFGTGLEFCLFTLPIGRKSKVEFEAGPLASVLLDENNSLRFAPVLAGRFRFLKNQDFVLYMGTSYSIGIDAMGVLFGTGYIF